jgi:hypothetical protein
LHKIGRAKGVNLTKKGVNLNTTSLKYIFEKKKKKKKKKIKKKKKKKKTLTSTSTTKKNIPSKIKRSICLKFVKLF